MTKSIIVKERFCGPPESGNGGYVAGLIAKHLEGSVEVTLRKPIPLETPLAVVPSLSGLSLMHGEAVIAEGRGIETFDDDVASAPRWGDVEDAMRHPIVSGDEGVSFGHCFVCGADRKQGDGLHIVCGRLPDGRSASLWTPDASLCADDGKIDHVYLWAALDCPGYAALHTAGTLALLGRFSAEIYGDAAVGEALVVCGEAKGQEGRKHFTETTLYRSDGSVLGRAKAIWISVPSL